jgi:hypothetical protein
MAKTIADQFAEVLATAGVKRIYGIVGDSLNGQTDALRRQGIGRIAEMHRAGTRLTARPWMRISKSGCQRRSKTGPLRRSKTRPVWGGQKARMCRVLGGDGHVFVAGRTRPSGSALAGFGIG